MSKHTCHWPGCTVEIPLATLMCRDHWFTVPMRFRHKIIRAQAEAFENHMTIMKEIDEWISTYLEARKSS